MSITNFPQKELTRGLQAVPTSLTFITGTSGKDTFLFQIVVANTTASTITFTLQDAQGTPLQLYKDTPVDPGYPLFFSMDRLGVLFKSGVKWIASGSGLVSEVVGVRTG